MKILVIGGGGREHALAWKISQSPQVEKVYCAPGNAGIAQVAECISLKVDDISGIVDFSKNEKIDLVVVGPELPLTLGLVDALNKEGIKAFGPNKLAAELEGSKAFSKDLMKKYDIPTASYGVFTDAMSAKNFAREMKGPWVVKADGLAAGKGVLICSTLEETDAAIDQVIVGRSFGSAGDRLVLEEFLDGEELSMMAFCDGNTIVPMVSAQDHKRVFSGDKGPNTGGMGAYSPAPVLTDELYQQVQEEVLERTMKAMAQEGRVFKGILYAGLMITKDGPKVLEYNVRFGDPETQVVLPRLESDIVDIMLAVHDGTLENTIPQWNKKACVTVVMASGGYPGEYIKGHPIKGLTDVSSDALVFHSGTTLQNGEVVTNGGRVLAVTALGQDIKQAVDNAYQRINHISFKDAHYRDDIAYRAFLDR